MKNDIKWDEPHSFGFWLGYGFRSIFDGIANIIHSITDGFDYLFNGAQVKARYITHKEKDD